MKKINKKMLTWQRAPQEWNMWEAVPNTAGREVLGTRVVALKESDIS